MSDTPEAIKKLERTHAYQFPSQSQLDLMTPRELDCHELVGISCNDFSEFNFIFSNDLKSEQKVKCGDSEEKFLTLGDDEVRTVEIYTRNAWIGYGQVLEAVRLYSLGMTRVDLFG